MNYNNELLLHCWLFCVVSCIWRERHNDSQIKMPKFTLFKNRSTQRAQCVANIHTPVQLEFKEFTHWSSEHVPAQLDSLARFDSRQIGPGLIWRKSNWAKECQYGLDHKTIEQNKFYDSVRLSYILLCNSLALSGIQSIFGMEAPWHNRHQSTTSLLW